VRAEEEYRVVVLVDVVLLALVEERKKGKETSRPTAVISSSAPVTGISL